MATVKVAFRLTVYKPRSVASAETAVLVPAAGAAHSDDFKVASITGVSGFQPYLDGNIRGRAGKLDALTKHTDVGELTLRLLDMRTTAGGSNLSRWLSAFWGDVKGVRQLEGCKALVEQSTDGGTTWATFWTGRIWKVAPDGSLLWFKIVIRDTSAEKMRIFTGQPHSTASYAGLMWHCPVGVAVAYGNIPVQSRLTGVMDAFTFNQAGTAVYHGLRLDTSSINRIDNVVTEAVRKQLGGDRGIQLEGVAAALKSVVVPMFDNRVRCRLRNIGAATEGTFRVGAVTVNNSLFIGKGGGAVPSLGGAASQEWRITGIVLQALDSTDPDYLAMPADATACNGYLYVDDVVSAENPLLIGDVAIGTLWKDLCDGYFSRLYPPKSPDYPATVTLPTGKSVGNPIYGFTHQDADSGGQIGFTSLIADATFPTVRFVVTSVADFRKWVEEHLLRPFQLGYRLTADGKIQPLDLRMPTSLPATTIADADLITLPTNWEPMPESAIGRVDAKAYAEFPNLSVSLAAGLLNTVAMDILIKDQMRQNVAQLVNAGDIPVTVLDLGGVDVGDNALTIDFQGLRAQPLEKINGMDRRQWCIKVVDTFVSHLRTPFGRGPVMVTLEGRQQSANVTDCQAGDLRLVTVSSINDPGTNLRGGTRVMRCLGWREDGLRRYLTMLDLGINVVADAPTVGTPTQNAADTQNAIDVLCTVNAASEPLALHVALTTTSVGTRPADTSALWFRAALVASTATVTVRNLPSGMRAWVRVRTEPLNNQYPRLPSAWAYPAGTGYVATAAITAPSALAETGIAGGTFTGTWTVGNAYARIKVYLAVNGETLQHIDTLPAGSVSYPFSGLDLSTAYDWGVSHDDGMGGETAVTTRTSISTTGTKSTCPAAGSILLLAGTV